MKIGDWVVRPGTTKTLEDMLIANLREGFFGVLDGVSAPYHPDQGPTLYEDGTSGGQRVVNTLAQRLLLPQQAEDLETALFEANMDLAQEEHWTDDAGLIPGASLALAQVHEDNVLVISAGDSLAVWKTKRGQAFATPNHAYEFEHFLEGHFQDCLARSRGNLAEAWRLHLPVMQEWYRKHKNKTFAEMNGQMAFLRLWIRRILRAQQLEYLILFTDGLVPLEWTQYPDTLAHEVSRRFERGRKLRDILESRRSSPWEQEPEVTAIVLEFP